MSLLHGKRMRIVGWYHSHPKITVWPSHVGNIMMHFRNLSTRCQLKYFDCYRVDTDTQAVYQMMDETFVGLIFSCFNEDKSSFEVSSGYGTVCQRPQYLSISTCNLLKWLCC